MRRRGTPLSVISEGRTGSPRRDAGTVCPAVSAHGSNPSAFAARYALCRWVMSSERVSFMGSGLPPDIVPIARQIPADFCHLPGRPGEFHPEPPTDPDVNLSIHPARATQ